MAKKHIKVLRDDCDLPYDMESYNYYNDMISKCDSIINDLTESCDNLESAYDEDDFDDDYDDDYEDYDEDDEEFESRKRRCERKHCR